MFLPKQFKERINTPDDLFVLIDFILRIRGFSSGSIKLNNRTIIVVYFA